MNPQPFNPLDLLKARSLFRSLFMEGWHDQYPTWQEAISLGSLHWSFNAESFKETVPELDQLLTYPGPQVNSWLRKVCSGLPTVSPDKSLTGLEFIRQVRDLINTSADQWEREGRPRRQL